MLALDSKLSDQKAVQVNGLVVEWKIAEDDREWELAQNETLAAPSPMRSGRRRWIATAVIFFCLLSIGGRLWHQANAGLNEIEGELQAAVEADLWQAQQENQKDGEAEGTIQAITAGQQLPRDAHVQLLDLKEDWALVRVTTIQGELFYRQARFYRRGESGWYAAAPSASVWGAPRVLETTHFIFRYYAFDAEAVAEAAVKLDALYPDLVASYPLDPTALGKQEIWVTPEYSLVRTISESPNRVLKTASPASYLAPTVISEGDILAQAVFLHLLDVLTAQSMEYQYQLLHDPLHDSSFMRRLFMSRLHALLESLRLWQVWNTELPLATLHKPTMTWVYKDGPRRYTPPDFDAQLCSLHQLWKEAPVAIQVPLFCSSTQLLYGYEVGRYFPFEPTLRLEEIHLYANTTPDEPYNMLVGAERIGLVTIFDYAAATYGRESVATLVANAASHSTWETLIPATFGVSYDNFEAGWQTHLRSRYEVSVATTP